VACLFLAIAGWFLLTFLMTANTMVQMLSPDELRGRVFAIYSLALIGMSPVGALFVGELAHFVGTRHAVLTGSLLGAGCTVAVYGRFGTCGRKGEANAEAEWRMPNG